MEIMSFEISTSHIAHDSLLTWRTELKKQVLPRFVKPIIFAAASPCDVVACEACEGVVDSAAVLLPAILSCLNGDAAEAFSAVLLRFREEALLGFFLALAMSAHCLGSRPA